MSQVLTQKALAAALGVNPRKVTAYKARGAPIPDRGPYDVEAIRGWVADHFPRSPSGKSKLAKEGPKEQSLTRRKLAAEVRIKEAQADQEEAKRDRLRGSLITVIEAKREITGLMIKLKTYLLAVPRSYADQFVHLETPAEAEALLMSVLMAQLETVSDSASEAA